MKIYYAHCINIFDTIQESRDIQLLEGLGFDVYNPNNPDDKKGYDDHGMHHFKDIVFGLPALAFRALPLGIPSGVFREVVWARMSDSMVIELPSSIIHRQMSINATREYIIESGRY